MASALFVSRNCGSPCGKLNMSLSFREAKIPDRCMLTWEEDYYGPFPEVQPTLLFHNGTKIHIKPSLTHSDGSKTVRVRIEASTGADLEDGIAIALKRIGGVVEEVDPQPTDSFVRGVRNDLRDLKWWLLGSFVAPVLRAVGTAMRNFAHRRRDKFEARRSGNI